MIIGVIIFSMLGLILGSFATALIHRVPHKKNLGLVKGRRSQCTSCQNNLSSIDLIPLFSWLLNRGRCRQCKARVPLFYPIVEVLSASACLGVFFAHGLKAEAFILLMAVPILISLLVIDIKYMILPNSLVLALGFIGFISVGYQISLNPFHGSALLFNHLGGAILFGLFIFVTSWLLSVLLKKNALGMGDVKFFIVAGLWLGLDMLPLFCLVAGVFGLLFGIGWRVVYKTSQFPFGPALIVAFYVLMVFPLYGFGLLWE